MTPANPATTFGWRIYGLGVIALALVCLAWGDFDPGQPVPKAIPDRVVLAYAAAAFMLVAGAAVEWRRTTAWAAAALTAYYALVVVMLMHGRVVLRNSAEFGAYSGAAVICLAASVSLLATIPASVYGFAAIFGLIGLGGVSPTAAIVPTVLSIIIGAVFGIVSELVADKLTKTA